METDLAYLAGVIDCDGCVSTGVSKWRGRTYYAAKVTIAGTRRQPHDLAVEIWGGSVSGYDPPNPRHRRQYQWNRSGSHAAKVLADVLPYLRIKKRHAELALDLQERVLIAPFLWPLDIRGGIEEVHAEIRSLTQDRRAPLGTP